MSSPPLENETPGIKNYSISAKKRGGDIIFLRKIVPGGADDSYGIEVAGLAGVPEAVIKRAKTVLSALEAGGTGSSARPGRPDDGPDDTPGPHRRRDRRDAEEHRPEHADAHRSAESALRAEEKAMKQGGHVKNAFKFPMKKSERIAGLVYLAVHACVLPWLIVNVVAGLFGDGDAALTGTSLNLIYYVIGFAFVMIFLFRYLKTSFSDLIDNLLGSLSAVALGYLFNYAALSLVSLLLSAVLDLRANPNTQEIVNQTKLDPNAVIVVAVLLVPVVEETLFRGALFGTLRTKSRLAAYIVSVALFSVYHLWQYFLGGFEWHMLLYLLQYLPASLALCWCYEKSGSVWAPIALHAAINFISIRVTLG